MSKKVEFKIPPGYTVPEGTENGGRWQEMGTYQLKGNGMMCLVAIGEHKMPGYEDKDESAPMQVMQNKASTRYGEAMGSMAPTSGGY